MLPNVSWVGDTAHKPILVVEYDRGYAALVRAAFGEARVHNSVDLAVSDQEAIKYLDALRSDSNSITPALIILGSGAQFNCSTMVRWIRRQPHLLEVPCVVLSANGPQGKSRVPHELVCECYVEKPTNFKDLVTLAVRLRDKWLLSRPAPATNEHK